MNPTAGLNFLVIDTVAQLEEAAVSLAAEKSLAVDLEADSMYHLKEKVCLIQLASRSTSFIIDPLAISDLSALKPLFANPAIQKIIHGADYDIRCLFRDFDITVNHLFDTQLASRFLGAGETGLDAVLLKRFNVEMNKKYQKKDWSQRPLPVEMLAYAARDVLYLIPLAETLQHELEQRDRLFWVEEENTLLSRVRPNSGRSSPLYLNFKGAGRLSPPELAILELLLKFRWTVAEKKDRPVFKILADTTLLNIVKIRPRTVQELDRVRPLSSKQVGMYGEALAQIVAAALNLPPAELPHYPHKRAPMPKPAVRRRMEVMKAWREEKGAQLGLDPALICNKGLIGDIAKTNPRTLAEMGSVKEMKNWQRKVFGEEIISVLRKAARSA